jgi:hypothetical protein
MAHKHRKVIVLLIAVLPGLILVYSLLRPRVTTYPVISFPEEVSNPTITIEANRAHIALDALPQWGEYLILLEQQGWRRCTFEICGFIGVTDTNFDVAYYYGQGAPPPILELYSGVWLSGGAYINLDRCGRITKTTQPTAPSSFGCTLRLPTASPSR